MELKVKTRLFLASALPCLVLDQTSKALAESQWRLNGPLTFWNGRIHLAYAENRGAFWGLGSNLETWARVGLLSILAACSLGILVLMMYRSRAPRPSETIGYSFIVAGGLCNVLDRMTAGFVVDFLSIELGSLKSGVLNIADIVIGAGLLLLVRTESQRLIQKV